MHQISNTRNQQLNNEDVVSTPLLPVLEENSENCDVIYEFDFVGHEIAKHVNKDVAILANEKQCSNVEKLLNYKPMGWLKERTSQLVSLIAHICDLDTENEVDASKLARCIEQLYACKT